MHTHTPVRIRRVHTPWRGRGVIMPPRMNVFPALQISSTFYRNSPAHERVKFRCFIKYIVWFVMFQQLQHALQQTLLHTLQHMSCGIERIRVVELRLFVKCVESFVIIRRVILHAYRSRTPKFSHMFSKRTCPWLQFVCHDVLCKIYTIMCFAIGIHRLTCMFQHVYFPQDVWYLPEILSRFRKEDLENFRVCWYSKVDTFVVQIILLHYFQKYFWYKWIDCFTSGYRVLSRR